MKHGLFLVLSLAIPTLVGCAGLIHERPSSTADFETRSLLTSLANRNSTLQSFKGIGKASVSRNGTDYFARLAWAGSMPGKLRVELFGAPGHPKTGFASDGKWLYYFDPRDTQLPVKKISAIDPNLERFISIPITSSEIVTLLSGRIPEYAHHSLDLQNRKLGEGYVLTLKKRWWRGSQKIYLDPTKKTIQKIQIFKENALVYQAEFQKMQTVHGYQVPSRLVISNDNGIFFKLDIDRYWANVSVSPEMFRLKPYK